MSNTANMFFTGISDIRSVSALCSDLNNLQIVVADPAGGNLNVALTSMAFGNDRPDARKSIAPNADDNYRGVPIPGGQIKLVNHAYLKLAKTATEFILFPNLPAELQDKIMTIAVIDNVRPGYIFIAELHDPATIDVNGNNDVDYVVRGAIPQPIFMATKAVTRIVEKLGMYTAAFKVKGCRKVVFYRPDFDIVHLSAHTNYPFVRLPSVMSSKDISSIQHLHLDARLLHSIAQGWVGDNLEAMASLRELHLVGNFHLVPGFQAPGRIHMAFYNSGKSVTPLFTDHSFSPSLQTYDNGALKQISVYVTDQLEIERYHDMWDVLDDIVNKVRTIPTMIFVMMNYHN